MREIFAFLFAAFGYVFVYLLALFPTRALIDMIGVDDNKYIDGLKAVAALLIPALISWIMNDFVLGSNGMLDDPNGARGIGPIEW